MSLLSFYNISQSLFMIYSAKHLSITITTIQSIAIIQEEDLILMREKARGPNTNDLVQRLSKLIPGWFLLCITCMTNDMTQWVSAKEVIVSSFAVDLQYVIYG